MRSVLGTIAAALLLAGVTATNVFAFGAGSGTTRDVANESEIREVYKQFTDAWNRHDVDAMANEWAIDGDHIEPDGTVAKSREEVRALLRAQHSGVFKDTKLELSVRTVWFVRGDVALIDGNYLISGVHDLEGNEIPPRGGHLTSLLIQEKGKWWIAASRLMIPMKLPYKKK